MNLDFFSFNGYGVFVWPAFVFTFLACTVLFIKTRQQLKKYEQMFSKELEETEIKAIKDKKVKKIYQLS
tara:strand:+ start:929 stop:1135 length:207 start_codon:yes stop_codon:yes gene_type:complete